MLKLSPARTVLAAIGAASALTACTAVPTPKSPIQASVSSSPAPGPPSTTPPSTTPPSTTEAYACVTSAANGLCNFGPYTGITGADSNPWVGNDMWNPIAGASQTMYANSPGDFYVTANMPAGNTAVVSYANTGTDFTRAVSAYTSITSSFTESMNATSGTVASAAYDMWFSGGGINEVMIHHDLSQRGGCGTWAATNVTFGGSNGVPVRSDWKLCIGGTAAFWQVPASDSFQSGSVDILAMVQWLISHRYMAATAQFASIGYGWEICSTGGKNENFQTNSFRITAA